VPRGSRHVRSFHRVLKVSFSGTEEQLLKCITVRPDFNSGCQQNRPGHSETLINKDVVHTIRFVLKYPAGGRVRRRSEVQDSAGDSPS